MPRNDKTGPNGEGPMTGRRMGICCQRTERNDAGRPLRRGSGCRGGRDFFRGNRSLMLESGYSNEDKEMILKDEVAKLKDQLATLEKRITEIQESK